MGAFGILVLIGFDSSTLDSYVKIRQELPRRKGVLPGDLRRNLPLPRIFLLSFSP